MKEERQFELQLDHMAIQVTKRDDGSYVLLFPNHVSVELYGANDNMTRPFVIVEVKS